MNIDVTAYHWYDDFTIDMTATAIDMMPAFPMSSNLPLSISYAWTILIWEVLWSDKCKGTYLYIHSSHIQHLHYYTYEQTEYIHMWQPPSSGCPT